MDNDTLHFGDDINSTPLASLQQPPASRKDMPPVEPPAYDPQVPVERHVRFDIPEKKKKNKKKKRSKRSSSRNEPEPAWLSQQQQYYYHPQQQPVAPAPAAEPKKKKLVEFLTSHAHALLVFVLVGAILWYLPRIAGVPYMGSESGGLSTLGTVITAVIAAIGYTIGETILD